MTLTIDIKVTISPLFRTLKMRLAGISKEPKMSMIGQVLLSTILTIMSVNGYFQCFNRSL